jgi:hypothetical protein
MDILKKYPDGKIDSESYGENEVKFGNFTITLKDGYHNDKVTFEIKGVKSLSDKEFATIREIFEKYVIANSNLESNQRIDEGIVSERL